MDFASRPAASSSSPWGNWILFVVFYTLAANLPYWAASQWMDLLPLGWMCLEYALVGVLALYLPRGAGAVLLLPVIAVDLIGGISKTYWISPSQCLKNLVSSSDIWPARMLPTAGVCTAIALVVAVAAWLPVGTIRRRAGGRTVTCLAAFILIALSMDYLVMVRETGHMVNSFHALRPSDANRYSDFHDLWVSRYPFIRLAHDEAMFGEHGEIASEMPIPERPSTSAAAIALEPLRVTLGAPDAGLPNVVLIVVESWGSANDASIRDSLLMPYRRGNMQARYSVVEGTVPFYGSTVVGEARELCASRMGFHILKISPEESQGCLPARLAGLGYGTLAVHGMSGRMFDRSHWYSDIGFKEQWFREQFRQAGLPDCAGAFIGTCDAEIAGWLGQRLAEPKPNPEFLYWVTLNTHLPLSVGVARGTSCSISPALSRHATLCSWYQLEYKVHNAIAALAASDLARPTIFVIVGDHAPPFSNPDIRGQFSSADVPYVLLMPRHDGFPVSPHRPHAEQVIAQLR